jgi:hypothetical protein
MAFERVVDGLAQKTEQFAGAKRVRTSAAPLNQTDKHVRI